MPNKAIFFWGGWEGHEPRRCVERVAEAVRGAGLETEIHEGVGVLDDRDRLAAAAVLIPCVTMAEITGDQERNLVEAVAGGVGLAGWHGGMGDAFRSATNYQWAVGGQFVAHPGGIIDYRVDVPETGHPVTRGLASFAVRSEQYLMHVDPSNEVLATTTFSGEHAEWTRGLVMPVVWTRRHGRGRVAYSALGHACAEFDNPPVLELAKRCVLWAAGRLA